jgi:hypothetical protein
LIVPPLTSTPLGEIEIELPPTVKVMLWAAVMLMLPAETLMVKLPWLTVSWSLPLSIETARLPYLDALAAIGRDPKIMRHVCGVQTREQTQTAIERVMQRRAMYGFGWWVFLRPRRRRTARRRRHPASGAHRG